MVGSEAGASGKRGKGRVLAQEGGAHWRRIFFWGARCLVEPSRGWWGGSVYVTTNGHMGDCLSEDGTARPQPTARTPALQQLQFQLPSSMAASVQAAWQCSLNSTCRIQAWLGFELPGSAA
eukprot:224337-Chlamydomonas_euryale.AAC.4